MDKANNLMENIKNNMAHPAELEKLYRKNKSSFHEAFNAVFPDLKDELTAQIWNERLNHTQEKISWGNKTELIIVVILSLVAGFLAKIPDFTGYSEELFYSRNIALLVFPLLVLYFSWKKQIGINKLLFPVLLIIASALYINLLPNSTTSDTIILACIHLPLFLWAIWGYIFIDGDLKKSEKKIAFLRYNGDFLVMVAVILLSCIIFTAITFGMFRLIEIDIQEIYSSYVIKWGLPAIPLLATYLIQNNSQLTNKISPVIAKIFTPIVFITLFIFLSAVVYTGKYPYDDREFLLIFNALLIGVMALILFSVSEVDKSKNYKSTIFILFGLSFLTIIVNGIALSAILFRINQYGITPNRIAVLGTNILIMVHLLSVARKIYESLSGRVEIIAVEKAISFFLPIYIFWTGIVTFLLPVIFNFK